MTTLSATFLRRSPGITEKGPQFLALIISRNIYIYIYQGAPFPLALEWRVMPPLRSGESTRSPPSLAASWSFKCGPKSSSFGPYPRSGEHKEDAAGKAACQGWNSRTSPCSNGSNWPCYLTIEVTPQMVDLRKTSC